MITIIIFSEIYREVLLSSWCTVFPCSSRLHYILIKDIRQLSDTFNQNLVTLNLCNIPNLLILFLLIYRFIFLLRYPKWFLLIVQLRQSPRASQGRFVPPREEVKIGKALSRKYFQNVSLLGKKLSEMNLLLPNRIQREYRWLVPVYMPWWVLAVKVWNRELRNVAH